MKRLLIVIGAIIAVIAVVFLLLKPSSLSINLPANPSPSSPDPTYTDRSISDDARQLTDTQYGFSITYPSDLSVARKDEGGGASTFTFENDHTARGFQLFVVPFAGTQITTSRFRIDEPSGVRDNPQNVTIDGATGASFFGQDAVLGDTAEVWFVHQGYLFEVTALKPDAQWLSTIMATWKFI